MHLLMILSAELKRPIGRDELEPLYLALAYGSLDGAVLVDDNAAALLLLRGALVVGEGTRL